MKIINKDTDITTISPSTGGIISALREVANYRHLLFTFAQRDFKVRFAQTYLGYWWGLLQPLAGIAVLYFVFGRVIKVPTDGVSYFPFALSGLVLWNYFNFVVTQASSSLITAQSMIKKIYFPRLCLPLSKVIVGLVELGIGFLILIIALIVNQNFNWLGILGFFPLLLFIMTAALGLGLWISALSIRFRDLQQILPFFLQLLFFLTPIAYASGLLQNFIPLSWKWILYLNPLMGILEMFRASLFSLPISQFCWISLLTSLLLLVSGLYYFSKVEKEIADLI